MPSHPKKPVIAVIIIGAVIFCALLLFWLKPKPLEHILKQKELIVLTRNAPTTYFDGRDGPDGFEYQLTQAFAKHLGVTIRYELLDSVEDILNALANNQGHLAAAGITKAKARKNYGLFGPVYMSVKQQLVCHRNGPKPKSIEETGDLSLLIAAGTSYETNLIELQRKIPELRWQASRSLSTEQILHHVWQNKTDCTIADSNIVAINRRYYPDLAIRLDMSESQPITWLVPANASALQTELNSWFTEFQSSSQFDELYQHFYAYAEIFDYVDLRAFKRRIKKRLPKFKDNFTQAAKQHGFHWLLLAAQAYQESHWNPNARSPTGVRGIMMLTRNTAGSLGIKDRLDPKLSIEGGARYLAGLYDRLPVEIKSSDRLWFALAAYNIGMGHIYDARRLAVELNKNPNTWADLKEVLPLLTQKKYYKQLKYGYARGTEPVRYVSRIRNYYDILRQELAN